MSKNMTRKGLAFGAGLALIGSTFAALPAQASTVTLSPSAGTSYNTLTSSTFKLMPVLTGLSSADYKYLRYKVTNADSVEFRVDIEQGSTADGEITRQYGTTTLAAGTTVASAKYEVVEDDGTNVQIDGSGNYGTDAVIITVATPAGSNFVAGDTVDLVGAFGSDVAAGEYVVLDSSATQVVLDLGTTNDTAVAEAADTGSTVQTQSRTTDDSFVVIPDDLTSGNNVSAIGSQNYLKMAPAVLNTTAVATVQAWIDGNQNNTIDAGEISSAAQTVTWKPVSTLSATVAVDNIYASDASVVSYVTFTGDINYQQIDSGDVTTTLSQTTDASGSSALSGNDTDVTVAWNAVTGRFESTDSGLSNVSSADVFKVILEVDNTYDGNIDDEKASVSYTVATTVADPTFEANVVNSATAVSTQSSRSDTGSGGDKVDFATRSGTAAVLEGSTGFDVKIFVGTDAVTPLGISKAPVAIAVTGGTITATDAVTVGGKALVTGTTTTVNVATDSLGYATVPVTLGAADDDDTITFAFSAYGTSLSSSNLVVTVTDNTGDYALTQVTPGDLTIEVGDTVAIDYKIVDLFGANVTDGTHSVLFAPTAQTRSKAATWSLSVPVVAGAVSLSVVDDGTGVGSFTVNAKLVTNGTTSALTNGTVNVVVNVVADKDAAKIVAEDLAYGTTQAEDANNDGDYADTGDTDNTAALLLETKAFADFDSRYNVPTVAAPEVRDDYKVVVGGKVTNAAGTAIDGAPVTFAANGFLFFDGTSYAKDSITVHTGSTGIASVSVWSSVGGAQTITMTSGTATASQKLVFAAGTGSVASFTVTAPAFADAGTTADVTITAKDKYGNPAKGATVTLFSKGSGYLINTTGTTLSNGTFSTKLLLGSNDKGSAVISAVVTIDGVETTQTATITVGSEQKVNAGSFKGYVALYAKGYAGQRMSAKVGKDWVIVPALASDFERVVEFTGAGVDVAVRIYIDRVLMDTINLTTK